MATVTRKCRRCGIAFKARSADVARGWALYCSKSCKAIRQEQKTGQYRQMQTPGGRPTFTDAHLFDNVEHDCNKGD